jgi:hypothetical protein
VLEEGLCSFYAELFCKAFVCCFFLVCGTGEVTQGLMLASALPLEPRLQPLRCLLKLKRKAWLAPSPRVHSMWSLPLEAGTRC